MTNVFWIVIIVGLIVIEMLTTALVAVWAIPGALLGWVAALLGASPSVQLLLASSTALMGVVYAIQHFRRRSGTRRGEVGSLLGETVVVVEPISKNKKGAVQYRDVVWTAVVMQDIQFNQGDYVKVVALEGNKLIVGLVEEDK